MRVNPRFHFAVFAALLAAICLAPPAGAAGASDFPAKPVRIIVPSTPGGALDVLARGLSPPLTEMWKQPVIVDNRSGANGIIGTQLAARAQPDGLTLVILAPNFTINPFMYKTMPYKTDDFQPITIVGTTPAVVVINPAAKFRSLKELIAVSKAAPGSVTYASSGIGSSGQLQLVLLERLAGVKFTHVPYAGAGAATTDVVAGHVDMLATAIGAALPFIQSGNLIPIAVTTAGRSKTLPDVPTIAESGFPGYNVPLWYGMFVQAATPKDIVAKLFNDIDTVLKSPVVIKKINDLGLDIGGNTPEQFQKFIDAELKNWDVTVKEAGIKAD